MNTVEAQQGITQPPAAAVLTSNAPVSGGSAGGPYSTTLEGVGTGTWTVVGGQLPPGTTLNSQTGVISGTPTVPGTYIVTLRYQSTTGLIDFRTITIVVAATPGANADLALTAATPAPVAIGATAVYALTAQNIGPATATNVVVTDTLPAGGTFVSATASQGTCTHANGRVICSLGSLPAAGTVPIAVTVRLDTGGSHVNSATIAGAQADPVVTNNAAQATATTGTTFGPCTTTCFSGPSSFLAGATDAALGIDKADFNEDGRLDVAYSAASDSQIAVFFGNGAGGFGAPTLLPTAGIPGQVVARDYNGDGHQDLLVGQQNLPRAFLYLGNGSGAFGSPSSVEAGIVTSGLTVGDFNNDGRADVVVDDGTTGLVMLLGNGNGTFQGPVAVPGVTGVVNVVASDFSNDGNLDLAAANRTGNTVTILLGNGAGGFTPTQTLPTGSATATVHRVGDLNSDERADLVVTDTLNGAPRLRVFFSTLTGFSGAVDLNVDLAVTFTTSVDVDGDGDLDLISGGRSVRLHLNDGTGNFSAPIIFAAPPSNALVTGDFNGDGAPDLALASPNPGRLVILLNTCDEPPADLGLGVESTPGPVAEGATVSYRNHDRKPGPESGDRCAVHGFGFECRTGNVGDIEPGHVHRAPRRGVVHDRDHGAGCDRVREHHCSRGRGRDAHQRHRRRQPELRPDPRQQLAGGEHAVTGQVLSADLAITKTDSPDPVVVGTNLTYTLTVVNNGPDGATAVNVVDTLPAGSAFVSATPSQGTCSGVATVTCSLGSLANGATATVTIVVTPGSIGSLNNSATVSAAQTDPTQPTTRHLRPRR